MGDRVLDFRSGDGGPNHRCESKKENVFQTQFLRFASFSKKLKRSLLIFRVYSFQDGLWLVSSPEFYFSLPNCEEGSVPSFCLSFLFCSSWREDLWTLTCMFRSLCAVSYRTTYHWGPAGHPCISKQSHIHAVSWLHGISWCLQLQSMILRVFSNLTDCLILWLCLCTKDAPVRLALA